MKGLELGTTLAARASDRTKFCICNSAYDSELMTTCGDKGNYWRVLMIPMNDEELVNPEKRSSYIMLDINYFLFQTWRATEEDIRYGRGLKGGHDRFLVEAISSTSPGTLEVWSIPSPFAGTVTNVTLTVPLRFTAFARYTLPACIEDLIVAPQ